MTGTLTVRPAEPADMAAIDAVMARSFPRLLKEAYPPSIRVLAVPRFARVNPRLVGSGRYYVALGEGGRIIGAGGWSAGAGEAAEVRHVATAPDYLRLGVGRAILSRVIEAAAAAGVRRLDCLATRNAVPFYAAIGFVALGPVEVPLAAGISFPAERMVREL
ncbi:GNAT family N-acetyltransferase [Solirhodobacter olei]|uniref:GNAT family N-acetyltransferase n=1 Tax=Solirhodobacter olei TaxID=2493082 RepID=UPI000FD98326|nr:GNAT family N-acetyltransferase [Solirhodobacter olei]